MMMRCVYLLLFIVLVIDVLLTTHYASGGESHLLIIIHYLFLVAVRVNDMHVFIEDAACSHSFVW